MNFNGYKDGSEGCSGDFESENTHEWDKCVKDGDYYGKVTGSFTGKTASETTADGARALVFAFAALFATAISSI